MKLSYKTDVAALWRPLTIQLLAWLQSADFEPSYNSWRGCVPKDLYDAPAKKQVSKCEGQKSKKNLQNPARRASRLILLLHSDREGENIAFDVLSVCREVNPLLDVKRARFSALIPSDTFRTVNNQVAPNENESYSKSQLVSRCRIFNF
jgi:DNA topoisomerase III